MTTHTQEVTLNSTQEAAVAPVTPEVTLVQAGSDLRPRQKDHGPLVTQEVRQNPTQAMV